MANWSCLYNWFEFKEKADADKAFQRLVTAYDEFDWTDKSKVGIKFGYISDKLIQTVTSQKWGLETDLAYYIYEGNGCDAAISAGSDRDDYFRIMGSPIHFNLSWNYIFVPDKNVNILEITQPNTFNNVNIKTKFKRKSLSFGRTYMFGNPFLNEKDLEKDRLLEQIIVLFAPLFNKENKHYFDDEASFDIVFGRNFPEHGNVNFGVLKLFLDGSLFYETNGCYNILKNEISDGQYLTPIEDEPVLDL